MSSNKLYWPNYKRFEFGLHYAFESRRWFGIDESQVSAYEKTRLKVTSALLSTLDKVGYEHFDYVIAGNDPLLALIQAKIITDKGKRALIYPSNTQTHGDALSNLISAYSGLESIELLSYLSRRFPFISDSRDIKDVIYLLSKSMKKGEDEVPLAMLVDSDTYVVADDWTSFYKGKPQFIYQNVKKRELQGLWKIPESEMLRFTQHPHVDEGGYFGVEDMAIITFDSIILNTRPDYSMKIDHKKHSAKFFSDAKYLLESKNNCSVKDRIFDIEDSLQWLSKRGF